MHCPFYITYKTQANNKLSRFDLNIVKYLYTQHYTLL